MRHLHWLSFLVIALGVTGCDHATKVLAASALSGGQSHSLLAGLLSFEQVRNTDTAFGLLSTILPTAQRLSVLRITATLGVLFVACFAAWRFRNTGPAERLAWALTLGGACGNAVDRWQWGYVVDFIHVEHWPTFNVADVALSAGSLLLLLSTGVKSPRIEVLERRR